MKRIWRQHEALELVKQRKTNGYVGMTSGYFNPFVHLGHLKLFEGCKNWCDFLIVVVNGTESTEKKYGKNVIPIEQRLEYISHIRWIDAVIDWDDDNMGQAIIQLDIQRFLKGGDRQLKNDTIDPFEIGVCEGFGCEIIDGVGGYEKIDSNSDWINKWENRIIDRFTGLEFSGETNTDGEQIWYKVNK